MHFLPRCDQLIEVLASGFQNLSHVSSFCSCRPNFAQFDRSIAEEVYNHDRTGEFAVRVSRFMVPGVKSKTDPPNPNRTHHSTIT